VTAGVGTSSAQAKSTASSIYAVREKHSGLRDSRAQIPSAERRRMARWAAGRHCRAPEPYRTEPDRRTTLWLPQDLWCTFRRPQMLWFGAGTAYRIPSEPSDVSQPHSQVMVTPVLGDLLARVRPSPAMVVRFC
jgi:hypothetical protein